MLAGDARLIASDWTPILGVYRNPEPIAHSAKLAKSARITGGSRMQTLSAKDAKYSFGRLIDLARAEPVTVAKHGRPVIVVMAVEEFERLKSLETAVQSPERKAKT
jgi:prevent-host-death family protein